MSYLSTSFMLYSFITTEPADALSGTGMDSISPDGKFESAVLG